MFYKLPQNLNSVENGLMSKNIEIEQRATGLARITGAWCTGEPQGRRDPNQYSSGIGRDILGTR